MAKQVERYENEDGGVNRRVKEDLGGGQRVTMSDREIHPDVNEFVREHPDAKIMRRDQERALPSPEAYTLEQLPDFLQSIDSVDDLLTMRDRDGRKMAQEMYMERIAEIVRDGEGDAEGDEE